MQLIYTRYSVHVKQYLCNSANMQFDFCCTLFSKPAFIGQEILPR